MRIILVDTYSKQLMTCETWQVGVPTAQMAVDHCLVRVDTRVYKLQVSYGRPRRGWERAMTGLCAEGRGGTG